VVHLFFHSCFLQKIGAKNDFHFFARVVAKPVNAPAKPVNTANTSAKTS
jgi:hypothetical protein